MKKPFRIKPLGLKELANKKMKVKRCHNLRKKFCLLNFRRLSIFGLTGLGFLAK